ncbi:MAG: hypothetical protein SAJ37_18660 [Oscillatoria sp. PMC 1068.18]|nr:hypothetical protein [Oscillatoria sp. PMC 1076.18]MEC4990759.1 hypothetical protein [Oscillatoria sp. PMC 1068.18]
MNTKLVNSLMQILNFLTAESRKELVKKLVVETSEMSTEEIVQFVQNCHSFDFLENEPDIYTLEDGEPV